MNVPAPVFILAAPFCGASSLAAMLGRHPRLCAVPELHLFMADRVDQLLEIFRISQGAHADGLLRAVAVLEFGAQSDANIGKARLWLEQHGEWSTGELAQYLARRAAPRRLVIPESDSTLRPMDLRRVRLSLPEARVLHLLRHPYTQGLLFAHVLEGRLFVPPDYRDHSVDPPRIDPQIPWLRCNRNIAAALPKALRLRSEDFVRDAATPLLRICEWLELGASLADLAAMQRSEDWEFAGYGPSTAPYGLETEVLEPFPHGTVERALDDARLDAQLPWNPAAHFAPEVATLAREFGYR